MKSSEENENSLIGNECVEESQERPQEQSEETEVKETILSKIFHYVATVGHFIRLLFGLLLDERVDGKVKIFVGAVLTYIFAPIDFIPELFSGLFGMLDDFVLSAFALNVILNWVDPEVVTSHWHGEKDLLSTIQKGIKNAEILVPDAILKKIQAWIGKHTEQALVPVQPAPALETEEKTEERPKRRTSRKKQQ